ncbi:amidohydrolase family protein [Arenimonas metalli]|uniref:Amidohydrolase-related domain-containing protein n=1 Tax=Arenimonas metalli CF5-1 TaxID=1384056 RepID=A0A091B0S2_9GAMM|nr:amidohydrolase family protein [Arenimonas metalli]KFN45177.1 hypothetical protein N787_13365 [Arenimonas metalli CF5-1]
MTNPARLPAGVLLAAALATGCASLEGPAGTTLVFESVNVVDTVDGRRLPPQDVFVAGDRIVALHPAGERTGPPGATRVDGRGRWLMPGLWDMHAHWYDEATLPVFTLHGVTGLRQMRGYSGQYATRAKGIEGTLAAPRVFLASPLVDGPTPASPPAMKVVDEASARETVRIVAASRADFLKVYDQVPKAAYLALRDEARRASVRIEGHVPIEMDWREVSEGGTQRSFEHLHSMMVWTARDPAALQARWLAYHQDLAYNEGISGAKRQETAAIHHAAYDDFDPAQFAALAEVLKRNDTWQTPTCILWRARKGRLDADATPDPRMRLVPGWMQGFWASWWPKDDPEAVAADFAVNERRDAYCLARTRELHEAGVPLLAGSDTIMPYVFPGSSLHEELALMVEAGLPPLAALQAATSGAARFMGRDDLGVVRTGALADLVLVQGDPLADISNTTRIEGFAIGGKWIDSSPREAGLDRIARIVAAPAVADAMGAAAAQDGLDAAIAAYDARCPAPPEQADCGLFNAYYAVPMALANGPDRGRIAEFEDWLETTGASDADLLSALAQARFERGELPAARRLTARALAIAPGDPLLMQLQQKVDVTTVPAAGSAPARDESP